jgi:hypothetical protein
MSENRQEFGGTYGFSKECAGSRNRKKWSKCRKAFAEKGCRGNIL